MTGWVGEEKHHPEENMTVKPNKIPMELSPVGDEYRKTFPKEEAVESDFSDENEENKSVSGTCSSPDSLSPVSSRPYQLEEDEECDLSPRSDGEIEFNPDCNALYDLLDSDRQQSSPRHFEEYEVVEGDAEGGSKGDPCAMQLRPFIPKVWSFESALDTTHLGVIPEEAVSEGSDGEWCEAVSSGVVSEEDSLNRGLINRRFRSASQREWIRRGRTHNARLTAMNTTTGEASSIVYLRYTVEFFLTCIAVICALPFIIPLVIAALLCLAPVLLCCGAPLMGGLLWFNRKFRRYLRSQY